MKASGRRYVDHDEMGESFWTDFPIPERKNPKRKKKKTKKNKVIGYGRRIVSPKEYLYTKRYCDVRGEKRIDRFFREFISYVDETVSERTVISYINLVLVDLKELMDYKTFIVNASIEPLEDENGNCFMDEEERDAIIDEQKEEMMILYCRIACYLAQLGKFKLVDIIRREIISYDL